MNAGKPGEIVMHNSSHTGQDIMYFSYKFPDSNWIYYLSVPVSDFYREVDSIRNSSIAIVLLSAVLLSAFILLFARRVKGTISELMQQAQDIPMAI